jgi:polysaccharide pyruvyl transferase WcaK-like protein
MTKVAKQPDSEPELLTSPATVLDKAWFRRPKWWPLANLREAKRPMLLLGSYGRGNLGDDVFLLAAAELFAGHKLYINSADDNLLPSGARQLVTTISTTSAGDVLKKISVFWGVKHIIYWGGDVWVELYGDRWPRQSLYKMVLLNALARLCGKKVHYIGCGIGKLEGWSLWLARLSARLASTVITREQRSRAVLGLPHTYVMPDLAINLPYFRPRLHRLPPRHRFVVGISLLYHVPDPKRNFPRLVSHLVEFIASLPADKFKVVLLPMLISRQEPHDDDWASRQVRDALKDKHSIIDVDIYHPRDLRDMVDKLGSFDLVIGARLHANVLATFNATPCLGIAYRAKVASFFGDNQLEDYCIDLESLEDLAPRFWHMYDHYQQVAEQFYTISSRNIAERVAYQELAEKYE